MSQKTKVKSISHKIKYHLKYPRIGPADYIKKILLRIVIANQITHTELACANKIFLDQAAPNKIVFDQTAP